MAGITWYRYGEQSRLRVESAERDALVDRFIPIYVVADRHHIRVDAPVEVTCEASTEMSLRQSPIVRGIFTAREWSAAAIRGASRGIIVNR